MKTVSRISGSEARLVVKCGNMGRVREKKRWRKEEKWRERGRRRDQPPFNPVSASATGCIGKGS